MHIEARMMPSRHSRSSPLWRTLKKAYIPWQRQPRRGLATAGMSLRHGPTEPALFTGTIPQHFASIVSQHGDRPAVIARSPRAQEQHLTYHALDLSSNVLARSLSSLGVRKGHRVAVSLGNAAEFATLTYALFKLGAVLVPLNPTFGAAQVEAALGHLGARVWVVGAVTDLAYKPGKGRSNEDVLRHVVGGDLEGGGGIQSEKAPCLKNVIVLDNLADHPDVRFDLGKAKALTPFAALLAHGGSDRPVAPDAPLLPSDVINIQYTSGTTSAPKAAMLTHTSILNNGALIAHRMGLDPTDRVVVPPPLFHCFGSVLGYMATAATGAAILFPSPAFDPLASVRMCADHEASGLYGVSTMFVAYMEALRRLGPAERKPRHLKKGIVAGSSVPESLMRSIFETLGLRDLVICYGMTETSPVSVMTSPSDPFPHRCTSIGTPMPHTSIKIVSPTDRDEILPLRTRGELAAAGYLVMQGYFGDAARTAESLVRDESGTTWMYSGDEAEMDERGYVRITGRIKDLIIRGGENIHPLEVENCLFQHPAIQEASVVGVPDERLGEAVAAFLIPRGEGGEEKGTKLTKEDVRAWVRDRLSGHLAPKYVFWIDEYPKTASGKIQKFKLREMAVTMLDQGL